MNKSIVLNRSKLLKVLTFIGFGGLMALIAPCKAFVSTQATKFVDDRIEQTVGSETKFIRALLINHCSDQEIKKAEMITGQSR